MNQQGKTSKTLSGGKKAKSFNNGTPLYCLHITWIFYNKNISLVV